MINIKTSGIQINIARTVWNAHFNLIGFTQIKNNLAKVLSGIKYFGEHSNWIKSINELDIHEQKHVSPIVLSYVQ